MCLASSCVNQVNDLLSVAGVLPPVYLQVLQVVGLCAAFPVVEAAGMHLVALVTC